MQDKTMDDEKRTDSDYIATEIAEVRISGPGRKSRTITVPGDAPLDEVKRRAYMVARFVAEYDYSRVTIVNGYAVNLTDGRLDDEKMPGYEDMGAGA